MASVTMNPLAPVEYPAGPDTEERFGISKIVVDGGLICMNYKDDTNPEDAKVFRVEDMVKHLKLFMDIEFRLRRSGDTQSLLYCNSRDMVNILTGVIKVAMYQREHVNVDAYTRKVQASVKPRSLIDVIRTGNRKVREKIVEDLGQGMYKGFLTEGEIGDVLQSDKVEPNEQLPFLDYLAGLSMTGSKKEGNVITMYLTKFRTKRATAQDRSIHIPGVDQA